MSIEISEEMVEVGAAAMYGKNWDNSDDEKRPAEPMKNIWRRYARAALTAALPLIEEKVRAECVRALEAVKNGPIDTSNLLFPELVPKVGEILNSYTDDLIAVITSGRQYP